MTPAKSIRRRILFQRACYVVSMHIRLALVGDYSDRVIAHRAIPVALQQVAARNPSMSLGFDWLHTSLLRSVEGYHGIWCVPASPYANEAAAIDAIRWARQNGVPFLGTCGGFQHAVLEFARHVLGLTDAKHAETAESGECLVISRLSCSLVEVEENVTALPGTRLAALYGPAPVRFGYHCSFGLNSAFQRDLQAAGLRVTARDADGEARAIELDGHPFFVGTLFQPERAALRAEDVPLAAAFVEAAASFARTSSV